MHPEKCILTWYTYSDHLKSMMRELMMNEDFSDVTLVTEDKKHIKANISILSACSPVFKDILKKEPNSNQIMYLRGVQFSEMESIMQFIFLKNVFKKRATCTQNTNVCLNLFFIISDECYIREVFIHHQFFHHSSKMI